MTPGSRCMSGNTCGCGMLWTYHWAVMVSWINTKGDRVLYAMAPHTITPAVGALCHCKAKAELRRSPRGPSRTSTIVLTAEIKSGFARR
ncbi:hypothetical protein TNCV_4189501 [Trichonephila clavipes]|nr:hypothetical protein TNCV_4189501 [Trichonephila clavipes]